MEADSSVQKTAFNYVKHWRKKISSEEQIAPADYLLPYIMHSDLLITAFLHYVSDISYDNGSSCGSVQAEN